MSLEQRGPEAAVALVRHREGLVAAAETAADGQQLGQLVVAYFGLPVVAAVGLAVAAVVVVVAVAAVAAAVEVVVVAAEPQLAPAVALRAEDRLHT